MVKIFCAVLLVLSLYGLPNNRVAAYINQLDEPFSHCQNAVRDDPSALISEMQSLSDTALSTLQYAKKNYCISLAYVALVQPSKAIIYAEKASAELPAANQPWLHYKIQLAQAEARHFNAEPDIALELANKVLDWMVQTGDQQGEMQALRTRGLIKTGLTDFHGAFQDLHKAHAIALPSNQEDKIAIGGLLGLAYKYQQEFDLALPYFQQALEFYRQGGGQRELSFALYSLGYIYSRQGNFNLAQQNLLESLSRAQAINDTQAAAYTIKELAYISIVENDLAKADRQLSEVEVLAAGADNPFMAVTVSQLQADVNIAKGNIAKAEQAIIKASEIVESNIMPQKYVELEKSKAMLLAGRGYYKGAYEKVSAILDLKTAVVRNGNAGSLAAPQSFQEPMATAQQHQALQEINNDAQAKIRAQRGHNSLLLLLLCLFILVCLLLSYIVYRNREVRRRLELMANLDGLTGVPNRRHTLELVETQLAMARRHQYPMAFAIIDLDNFKEINDNYGHPTGDRVLEAFGQLLVNNVRATDVIGRIGGEEFLIALPHTDTNTAFHVIDQLRITVQKIPNLFESDEFLVSFSCGLCDVSVAGTLSDLMACADGALYSAKEGGRDRIVVFNETSSTSQASLSQAEA